MTVIAAPRFAQLTPQLATAGQPSEAELRAVIASGFRVVINLGLHTDPSYALPDEAALVASAGGKYVHIPVEFTSPNVDQLREFSAAMAATSDAGEKVFVHCRHNKRVPVFVALDRILREGWPAETALAEMRTLWQPDAVWSAFIEHALSATRGPK